MRIERVALRGFLSHADTDWQPNGARLVTLVGANGAGKSSLLDAVAYALFDSARARTDELVQLGATDMSVTVEFVFAGGRYRVTRGRTTKAGGKSYLELAIADGDGWRPLTGPTIRDTQQSIEQLLRVDAATFETAVLLMQGRASAFAEATPAERKRILSTILGLDVYARAEAIARERATAVESQLRADLELVANADLALLRRPEVLDHRVAQEGLRVVLEDERSRIQAERAAADERLQRVVAEIAAGTAAEADVARLELELEDVKTRYRRARERRDSAAQTIAMADRTLAAAESVAAAAARKAELEQELVRLEELERTAAGLDEAIASKRKAIDASERAAEREGASWEARYVAARRAVDELTAAVTSLKPVDCPNCGASIVVDQAGLRDKLAAARREFAELEASRPPAPAGAARESAALFRLEERRRQLGHDPDRLRATRGELWDVAAQAARAEAVQQARTTRDRAQADLAAAEGELEELQAAGEAARTAHDAARERVAGVAAFRAERDELEIGIRGREIRLGAIAAELEQNAQEIGKTIAELEELDRRQAERDEAAAAADLGNRELARYRRLVAAFGVGGIPARIIESVLPELAGYAQELLTELRPGMALSIRAQRAKRDGSGVVEALDLVVRDAAGERPLSLFSGGERMSVSLALAVGLSRLVARRAGTALRTLVIDEPDGLDADARRAFGQALRVLAHHGELERVVVVSHHEDLAEIGDAIYRVTKDGHGSSVELVA